MSHSVIDLRSDTITKPTDAMRQAMCEADVGDDVYGEDPTVNKLESLAAKMFGKEAALFVPSGTMGNLLAILSHCQRGDEIIVGDRSHIFLNEQGGAASLGGVHTRTVPNQADGTLDMDALVGALRDRDNVHFPTSRLIALENTHNFCGGTVLTTKYVQEVAGLAHRNGLVVHVDGARFMNAHVALGESLDQMAKDVDSLNVCLSKGLGAPVGSILIGTAPFIARARRWRKAVGGGMRQCGILAAAGIIALTNMVPRLADDHANAKAFARGMAECCSGSGLEFEVTHAVETNIVIARVATRRAADVKAALKERGVLCSETGPSTIRFVFNLHVTSEHVPLVVKATKEALMAVRDL